MGGLSSGMANRFAAVCGGGSLCRGWWREGSLTFFFLFIKQEFYVCSPGSVPSQRVGGGVRGDIKLNLPLLYLVTGKTKIDANRGDSHSRHGPSVEFARVREASW